MSNPSEMASGARAILEAATEAFSRAGFDSVSLTDVANQAKVCKANIFHHFKSKDALYVEVLREACKGHAEFTEALLARSDLSSVDKLRQLIHFDFIDGFSNEQRFQLVIREILNTGCNTGRNLIEPVFLRNFAAVVGLIEQGKQRGEFRPDIDAAMTAMMIGGTVMLVFQNRSTVGGFPGMPAVSDPAEHAERVCQTILNGVVAAPVTAGKPTRSTASKPQEHS